MTSESIKKQAANRLRCLHTVIPYIFLWIFTVIKVHRLNESYVLQTLFQSLKFRRTSSISKPLTGPKYGRLTRVRFATCKAFTEQ